ncbi:isocitrate lyase/PEP mutase family protein [Mesorhizobium sp. CAU 1741]|uniref:isocitrate lyase/PEP mutase family protein n=1 Tax=Mesorhizobium sp. CAU 1741 TaxID=3140366 RepID=UPI00325C0512
MRQKPTAQLRNLLLQKAFFTAPGVYDAFSALVAERVGFPALYMTGYGTVMAHLGLPDAGLGTYSDFVGRLSAIVDRTNVPVIADADTGFGGLVNLRQTVRGYEKAGASAIQIEDQEFPKRCGHTEGKRVIPAEDMVLKIRVALDTRIDDDFCIIARTDARNVLGLDEALRRATLYAEAGADIIFVEAPESEAEMARIAAEIDAPLVANMTAKGSRTPEIAAEKLEAMGYALAIHPGLAMLSAAAAMQQALEHLKTHRSTVSLDMPMFSLEEMHELVGFPEIWAFEKRWGDEAPEMPRR